MARADAKAVPRSGQRSTTQACATHTHRTGCVLLDDAGDGYRELYGSVCGVKYSALALHRMQMWRAHAQPHKHVFLLLDCGTCTCIAISNLENGNCVFT